MAAKHYEVVIYVRKEKIGRALWGETYAKPDHFCYREEGDMKSSRGIDEHMYRYPYSRGGLTKRLNQYSPDIVAMRKDR